MRDWLLKPLMLVLAIVIVLAAFSVWWVRINPSSAGAATEASAAAYYERIERAMQDVEHGR